MVILMRNKLDSLWKFYKRQQWFLKILVCRKLYHKNCCYSSLLKKVKVKNILSFNPNLGGLFSDSFWGGGGGKITSCLKLVRIILETSNLARKYTSICSFRKYTFQCLGPLNFADVSIFLQKISDFCRQKYHYSKQ